jgi:hypothetical protein
MRVGELLARLAALPLHLPVALSSDGGDIASVTALGGAKSLIATAYKRCVFIKGGGSESSPEMPSGEYKLHPSRAAEYATVGREFDRNQIKHVPCKTCSRPTSTIGTRLCDGCWEVEVRLRDYLNKGPAAVRFVTGALAASLGDG